MVGLWSLWHWVYYIMFMVDPNVTMGLSMFIRYHPQMMFIIPKWFNDVQFTCGFTEPSKALCLPKLPSGASAFFLRGVGRSKGSQRQNIPWRIHGAAIYGVPWIPSIYPIYVSIHIPAPWIPWILLVWLDGFVCRIRMYFVVSWEVSQWRLVSWDFGLTGASSFDVS